MWRDCKYFQPVETVSIPHSESPIVSLWCNSEHESALGELHQMKLPRKNRIPCHNCSQKLDLGGCDEKLIPLPSLPLLGFLEYYVVCLTQDWRWLPMLVETGPSGLQKTG